jgi:hypothetical protein
MATLHPQWPDGRVLQAFPVVAAQNRSWLQFSVPLTGSRSKTPQTGDGLPTTSKSFDLFSYHLASSFFSLPSLPQISEQDNDVLLLNPKHRNTFFSESGKDGCPD